MRKEGENFFTKREELRRIGGRFLPTSADPLLLLPAEELRWIGELLPLFMRDGWEEDGGVRSGGFYSSVTLSVASSMVHNRCCVFMSW